MSEARRRSNLLGWLSLSLLVMAALALVVPVARFALASSDKGLVLGPGLTEVRAPGSRTWGFYLDDADNSGYSESCTATDAHRRTIALRGPGITVSTSDTETLDHVFTTPADGHFAVECDARGADARVGPVGSFLEVLLGVGLAAVLGLGALVAGTTWLVRRSSRTPAVAV